MPGMDEAKSLSILMCGEDQMGWEEPACHGATPTNKQRVTKPVELVGAKGVCIKVAILQRQKK